MGLNKLEIWKAELELVVVQAFNGKKWEKFNSEKVASLAYARIQGKAALVNHFQNSSLMNEDKRCRPILFHSETGDQVRSLAKYQLKENQNFKKWHRFPLQFPLSQ